MKPISCLTFFLLCRAQNKTPFCLVTLFVGCCRIVWSPKTRLIFSCCPVDWSPKTRPILSRRPLYLAVCCLGPKKRPILSRGPLYQGQLPPLLEASSPGCCLICFKGQYALYFFKTQKKPILEPIRVSTKNDPSWAQKKKKEIGGTGYPCCRQTYMRRGRYSHV